MASSGIAQAAGPASAPAGSAPAGPAAGSAGTDAIKKLPGKTFDSPADRTVTSPVPGEQAGQAAPAQGGTGTRKLSAVIGVGLHATVSSAHGIDLETKLFPTDTSNLAVTIAWGDGTTSTFNTTVGGGGNDTRITKHKYATVGVFDIKVTAKDASQGVQGSNQVTVGTLGAEFTPHTPTRVLDTRSGVGAAAAKVGARSTVALKIDGAAQIPVGAYAVVLNVTVTNADGPGHISVQPTKSSAENATTSNLNFTAGQTVPNLVVATVGNDGYVYLFNAGWQSVDLLADVTGYFTPQTASGYKSVTQSRVVDTRSGLGTAQGPVAGQSGFDVAIAGRNGVPYGVTAVALNLTVTNPQDAGHLTAYPSGQAAPTTSSVNFTAGQTVANAVIVPVSADGKISIRNGSWHPADVILDVVGYYTPTSRSALVPVGVPVRLLDTRVPDGNRPAAPVPARGYFVLGMEGDTTTPEVDGWVLNTTVTNTKGPGFLSVDPDPNYWSNYQNGNAVVPNRPVSSTLNWTAGATVPNVAQTSGGKGGIVDFWNQGWESADLLVDLLGYYESN
ncbi:hypothetical protein [Streptomyces sp. CBMA156]|uniref:hypothetical protein n=1 Tax=Streptomyces sp. CBMA156 TaxID=1930280 RepID=UPI001661F254|nr:hypothetical protein [Streptomyces sp. CBMA156]MBD0671546.1 hypothetical protein [Streptomyces sp. CBMA156]